MNIYVWSNEWLPGENTLAYRKFNNNLNDETWNMVASWSNISYWTIGNNSYVENTSTGYNPVITVTWDWLSKIWSWDFCVSMWQYIPSNVSNNQAYIFWEWYDWASPRPWITIRFRWDQSKFSVDIASSVITYSSVVTKWAWYNVIVTRTSWIVNMYINGVNDATPLTASQDFSSWSGHVFYLMGRLWWSEWTMPVTWFKTSELIYEKQSRTSDQVLSYYNSTKSTYWL